MFRKPLRVLLEPEDKNLENIEKGTLCISSKCWETNVNSRIFSNFLGERAQYSTFITK